VGKRVGDVAIIVTPNGKRELEVLKLSTIHDEAEAAKGTQPRTTPARQYEERKNDLDRWVWPRLRLAT